LLTPGSKSKITVLREDGGEAELVVTVGKRPPRKKNEE